MLYTAKRVMVGLLLLALSAQSGQATDDDFLLQILPGIISASLDKRSVGNALPNEPEQRPVITISTQENQAFHFQFEANVLPLNTAISHYLWLFGDGSTASGKSSSHRYSAPGVYVVSLQASTAKGDEYLVETQINVRPENKLPVAQFGLTPSSGYAPLTVQFDAGASFDEDGSISSYDWVFGDGLTGSGPQLTHQYQSQGVYVRYAATLTVTDDRQGQHKTTQYVSVNRADTLPRAHFEMSASEATAPFVIKFDASESIDLDGYITDYHWDLGDGHVSSGQRMRHTYTEAGQYSPLLTVTDNSGDEHTFSRQLTINPQNQDPHAIFSISSAGLSVPATIEFNATDSVDEDGSIVSYHWNFGDGQVTEGMLQAHRYQQPGDYIITLFVSDGEGGVGIAQKSLTITGAMNPEPGLSISSSEGETTDNPYMLSGHAEPGDSLEVYLDELIYQTVEADNQGRWMLPVPLQDGLNTIKIEATQDSESHTLLLKYRNTVPRDLSGKVINELLVLTPGVSPLPYVVDDSDLTIAEGGKLILQAGVEIQFNGPDWPGLSVNGILDVRGSADHEVRLTSDYLDEDGKSGQWLGIHISPEASYVSIRHAVIDRTYWAVNSINTPVTIENSLIRQGMIELVGVGESKIKDSRMEGHNSGLSIYGNSNVSIQGNTFAPDIKSIGVDCYASGCPTINMNGNNLLMNEPVHLHENYVHLRGERTLDARGNWWGTTDIHQIGDKHLDTRGFLDGPVPTGKRFMGEIFDQQGNPHAVDHSLVLQQGGDYFAYSDITVPSGVRLSLEAGATLRLNKQYSGEFDLIIKGELVLEQGANVEAAGFNAIRIDGGLRINGSEQMPVVFTSVQDAPGHEDWAGIQINSEAANVSIDHALIQHAVKGVSFSDSSAVLSNSELRDNKYGVWIEGNASPLITGNTISENETGIFDRVDGSIDGLQAQITRNNLQGNQQYAAYLAWNMSSDKTRALRENWWGSTVIAEISEQIFDGYDASNHAYVDFSDYLDGPVPQGEVVQGGVRIVSMIYEDTTFTADQHIIVIGDIYVAQGVTLTLASGSRLTMPATFNLIVDGALVLEPDVEIEFAGTQQRIEINGALLALGTLEHPVIFASSGPEWATDDWEGIHVKSTARQFTLEHGQIRNARRGIWFDGVSGEVHNSHFEQNEMAILGSGNANPDLQANTFNNNVFDVQILGIDIDPGNQAPVARFISNREADEGSSVVHFSAIASSDDGRIMAYHWVFSDGSHASGREVSLDFQGVDEHVVTLIVLDEYGATGQISKTIRYSVVNTPPVANAGLDQIVETGDEVILDAAGSYDDVGIVAYSWVQLHGPTVSLSDATSSTPSFIMPELPAGESLMFQLSVTDAQSLTSIDVIKLSQDRNLPPLAYAGSDQSVEAGLEVILNGESSTDPDGEIISYRWVQTEGSLVVLRSPGSAVASFTMPNLSINQNLSFDLSVTDNEGLVASDQVVISLPKVVTLNANVSSGIAPLNVSFRIDSKIPVTWVNMDFDGDGSIDVSQADIDRFTFRYEQPGVYRPYVGIKDDQGEWHIDQMTITVSDPDHEKAKIKLEWDAMMLALLGGNIEIAMHYFSDHRRDEFAYMFGAMGSNTLQAIFGGVEDIQLNEVSGGYAEIAVLRRQNGQLYAYPVGMIKDENGVWKILKM